MDHIIIGIHIHAREYMTQLTTWWTTFLTSHLAIRDPLPSQSKLHHPDVLCVLHYGLGCLLSHISFILSTSAFAISSIFSSCLSIASKCLFITTFEQGAVCPTVVPHCLTHGWHILPDSWPASSFSHQAKSAAVATYSNDELVLNGNEFNLPFPLPLAVFHPTSISDSLLSSHLNLQILAGVANIT